MTPFTVGRTPPSPEEAEPRGKSATRSAFANPTIFFSASTLFGWTTSSGVVSKSLLANGTSPMSVLKSSRSKSPSKIRPSSPTSSFSLSFNFSAIISSCLYNLILFSLTFTLTRFLRTGTNRFIFISSSFSTLHSPTGRSGHFPFTS